MNKVEARQILRNIRKNVNLRVEKEAAVTDKLLKLLSDMNVDSVFVYASFGSELSTEAFIRGFNGRIIVPYTNNETMKLFSLSEYKSLHTDKLGNLTEAVIKPTNEIPVAAIIPMLGFNTECYRLGYGGGYYDRFLCGYNGTKLGLAFDEQLMDELPLEIHDVRLDAIITPKNYYQSKNSKTL